MVIVFGIVATLVWSVAVIEAAADWSADDPVIVPASHVESDSSIDSSTT